MSIQVAKATILCDGCEAEEIEADLVEMYNGAWREDTGEALADYNMDEWTRENREDYQYRHFCPQCSMALGKGHDD